MNYDLLRVDLAAKGYRRTECKQCCLHTWNKDPRTHNFCGNNSCYVYPQVVPQSPQITPTRFNRALVEHFSNPREKMDFVREVIPLRRASTITTYSESNHVFAGLCAFEKLFLNPSPKALKNFGGKLYLDNQYCFRFDDLNQIGVTGRHCSGFTMTGLHLFETEEHPFPDNWQAQFFDKLYRFLLTLGIGSEELRFNEDYWRGGENEGACLEIFYKGVEIGNMVFIRSHMKSQRALDVGLGLQRILFLLGYPVRYMASTYWDHLRSLMVGTKDGADCSKIGFGYAMRKLLEQILEIKKVPFEQLQEDILTVSKELETYYEGQKFVESIDKLLRIGKFEEQRINSQ